MPAEITLRSPDGALEARFIPQLGMIGTSLRHHGAELLHQRGGVEAYARAGATFALPLLHPWASRLAHWRFALDGHAVTLDPGSPIAHRDGATGLPIHGLLAASRYWRTLDATPGTLCAELDFGAVPEYLAAFPFPHTLRYTATLTGRELTVDLRVTPTGSDRVPIAFGFHPYLTLPGSDRREWQLQIPAARCVALDAQMLPTGATTTVAPGELDGPLGEREFDTSFDRLYAGGGRAGPPPHSAGSPPPATFTLADRERRISVRHDSGYPVAQLYAPAGSDFVCWEPMTAPVNALVSGDGLRWVAPGDSFAASFAITVD